MFAEVDDLATYLGFTFDAADELRAHALLGEVTENIRGYTGQRIAPTQETTVTFQASGRLLFLPHPPAIPVDVSEVKVDDAVFDGWRLAVNDEGQPLNALERTDASAWSGEVAVTYTHGFAEAPGDVRSLALERAAQMFVNPEGHMQRRRGDASTSFASSAVEASGLNTSQQRRLERYRR